MTMAKANTLAAALTAIGAILALPTGAAAAGHHHRFLHVSDNQPGVHYDQRPQHGGSALVSDGPGTGFGFHRLPLPYRVGAWRARDRQIDAVHDAVIDSSVGNLHEGYPGSSVYQYGSRASYGVFTGGDSYGTPYFAGYYGPGDGADYGPFGHAYTD